MTVIPEIDQTLTSWCQISFLETLHLERKLCVKNDVFLMKTDLHEIDKMGFFKS